MKQNRIKKKKKYIVEIDELKTRDNQAKERFNSKAMVIQKLQPACIMKYSQTKIIWIRVLHTSIIFTSDILWIKHSIKLNGRLRGTNRVHFDSILHDFVIQFLSQNAYKTWHLINIRRPNKQKKQIKVQNRWPDLPSELTFDSNHSTVQCEIVLVNLLHFEWDLLEILDLRNTWLDFWHLTGSFSYENCTRACVCRFPYGWQSISNGF